MSSTLLERTRSSHEDLERLNRVLVAELKETPKNHKDGVDQSHRINSILDRIVETGATLERIYTDADGSRKDGIAAIAGSGPSLYSLFYDRLREIKEYHRKYPNLEVERPENLHIPTPNISFSGEEKYGKYVDLNTLFEQYVNLEAFEKIDYLKYLQQFYLFDKAPESRLYNKQYKKYIDELQAYLVSFFERTQPLFDLEKELQPFVKEFEAKWEKGEFQNGKPAEAKTNGTNADTNNNNNNSTPATPTPATPTPAPSSTPATSTPTTTSDTPNKKKKNKKKKNKKNKAQDPDVKMEPADATNAAGEEEEKKVPDFENPLYCRACAKLFSKDTVFKGHLSGKKHQQAQEEANKLRKDILLVEVRVNKMGEMLEETIQATRINVEHRQSQTLAERIKEQEEQEEEDTELDLFDDDEDDEPIRMTIKDYPIGWDGKPIPYWLYKLHGLGIEYKCEICGNTSYFGRKAFERHFQEWRHAHGMACLDIPNTRHFQEITKISDAVALWQKIKEDNKKVEWKPEIEEEYEDSEGHVMGKKTFEDLKRQGLLE
eukprot:Phypoly_transcript_03334.p1 GENE.Phypoly_transcript_03334~~Phypoly_transcript_03334.p1  ORF type:complete len:546 (-),score=135.59 Phypoly_transcript_03334:77-1714(-)